MNPEVVLPSWDYAGICGSDDLASHSIVFFHTKSFDEIVNYTTHGNRK
ncbi:MAG: hypothetical protein R2829_08365 [Bacteroidia bacterium]